MRPRRILFKQRRKGKRMKKILMMAAVAAAANAWAVTLTPQNAEIVTGAEACGVVTFAAKEMAEFLGKAFGAPV